MATEGFSGAASGGQLEEKLDLSKEVELKIPQASTLVDQGLLKDALALLFALEKKCRTGNDTPSLVKVCVASLQHCKNAGDIEVLLTTLQTLCTRRSQKTQAVRSLVELAMPWCLEDGHMPLKVANDAEKENRDKLVVALRDITDGKIFLEAERAKLTRALAIIKEEAGDIAAAADILQEVHVETYGSISKKDKIEFILEQIRLTLGKQDYVRAYIVANKISKKQLGEENMQVFKVRYYELMADYHRHEKEPFDLAKDYHAIYSTPEVLNDNEKWRSALTNAVLFLSLSPYGMDQQQMLHLIRADSNIKKLPASYATIQLLLKKEIIQYPLPHQGEIEAAPAFSQGGLAEFWKEMFHRRIIQHNVRIVSGYYKRIHGARLAELIGLTPERLEQEISTMVSDGTVYAKIDRPKDIIRFSQPKTPEAVLSDWAIDIDKLLGLVETTTHLIAKENMTQ